MPNRLGECGHDHLPRLREPLGLGAEQRLISQVLLVVAKHLPLVFGVFGFMGAFVFEVPVQSVFGTARWARAKDIVSMRGPTDTDAGEQRL